MQNVKEACFEEKKNILFLKNIKNLIRYCKIKKDFREEISHIQNKIKVLKGKIARKKIDLSNVDNFVKKTKRLAKSIIESHIYNYACLHYKIIYDI